MTTLESRVLLVFFCFSRRASSLFASLNVPFLFLTLIWDPVVGDVAGAFCFATRISFAGFLLLMLTIMPDTRT